MNKEKRIEEAKKLHEKSEEYRDVYEKLCTDIEIQETLGNYINIYMD